MPFRQTQTKNNVATPAREIFVGRTDEIDFFVQQILRPTPPKYRIVSISGQGGVGKSELLKRFQKESQEVEFRNFCLPVFVNEIQVGPIEIMKQFATQLKKARHRLKDFEKKLIKYEEASRKSQDGKEKGNDPFVQGGMAAVSSVVEKGIPVAGGIISSMVNPALNKVQEEQRTREQQRDAEFLENALQELTTVFVQNLNKIANRQTKLVNKTRRNFRILLFFDTYEKLAEKVTPWLLDYFLPTEDISANIILIIAGRKDVKQTGNDLKKWLNRDILSNIHSFYLEVFTENETVEYLSEYNIIDADRVKLIRRLSKDLPLYLGLLTSNPSANIDPTRDVIENFLLQETNITKRSLALKASLFSHPFNQEDIENLLRWEENETKRRLALEAATFKSLSKQEDSIAVTNMTENDRLTLYEWLINQSYVRNEESFNGRYLYHEVVQKMFSRYLFQSSPLRFYESCRYLADYYKEQLEVLTLTLGKQVYQDSEWLDLTLALSYQLLSLREKNNHIEAIERILFALQIFNGEENEKIIGFLQSLGEEDINNQAVRTINEFTQELKIYAQKTNQLIKLSAFNNLLFLFKNKNITAHQRVIELHLLRANWYEQNERYDDAIFYYTKVIELDPKHKSALIFRAESYRTVGQYDEAVSDLTTVIELEPKNVSAFQERGEIYGYLHQYNNAIFDFDKILELDPESAPYCYSHKGYNYLGLKKLKQAKENYEQSWELGENYIDEGWMAEWIGMCLQRADIETVQRLERMASSYPHSHKAYRYFGVAALLKSDYQTAIAELDKCIKLDSEDNYDSYFWKGMALAYLGKDAEVVENVKKALEMEMPPILMLPLKWFEQDRPEFYQQYALPLLQEYDLL